MKLRVLSDLHLEFDETYEANHHFRYDYLGEDVLVLAGDIYVNNQHGHFLKQIPEHVKILFVLGNHELYGNVYQNVVDYFEKMSHRFPNFIFLNNSSVSIDGVDFYGGMMCSDLLLYGSNGFPHKNAQFINDFQLSKITDRLSGEIRMWSINDHVEECRNFKNGLEQFLETTDSSKNRVVISHFLPSEKCIPIKYIGDCLNPYFASDFEKYMEHDLLWIYGHTHDVGNFNLNKTRLVCNPRGYPRDKGRNGFNAELIIEI